MSAGNWLRAGVRAIHSRGDGSRLTILIYHRVHGEPDELSPDEVDAATFRWQMCCLRDYFCVLPLERAVDLLLRSELPSGAVTVTFDDGYRDNHEVALPILRQCGIAATFFIATDYLGRGIMFNDVVIESVRRCRRTGLDLRPLGFDDYALPNAAARRGAIGHILGKLKYVAWRERAAQARRIAEIAGAALPSNLMMTPDQVRGLHRAGMSIGAHTIHHPILSGLDRDESTAEIAGSRHALEAIIGAPVSVFAYPNGRPGKDYGSKDVGIVRELGFAGAVSTAPGVASADTDIHQLPRFTPWDRSPAAFVARLLRNSFARVAERV